MVKRIILAAEQGDAHAQNNLGIIFRNGHGTLQPTPDDCAEAVKWFRRAAEQGHADAQHSLGVMYGAGQGIPQDLVQAHMWLSLALLGREGANREVSAGALDALAAGMTPGQIARARRLARTWHQQVEIPAA